MTDTNLSITGLNLAPYSARGLSQSLEPIEAASQLRRTVNGALVDVSASQLRKYRSTVTCTDANAPALDGVWPGRAVTVNCAVELSYLTSGGTPARTVVSGSSRTEGAYTFYRPQLSMRVVSFSVQFDEWGASTGWTLELEEA